MTTTFNAEQFEQTVVDGANQTSFVPIPEADYTAYVEEYSFRELQVQGEQRIICAVSWVIPDEDLAKELSMQEIKVKQDIWLDLTDDGNLDFGTNKNVQLGRLRQALDLNTPGFQWSALQGKQALISIAHTQKKDDPSVVYSNVVKTSKIEGVTI